MSLYVEIAAVSAAAGMAVLAGLLWTTAQRLPALGVLRVAAASDACLAVTYLVRAWSAESHDPLWVAVSVSGIVLHAWGSLTVLRRLRGWPLRRRWTLPLAAAAVLTAWTGLLWPAHAAAGLAWAHAGAAVLYGVCAWPAFARGGSSAFRALNITGACTTVGAALCVFWAAVLWLFPAAITEARDTTGPVMAASFSGGLVLCLAGSCGYLVLVIRQQIEALRQHAHIDALTGAANRHGLDEFLRRTADARPNRPDRGLILIDLDHFKRVNDSLGHAAGDAVLRACAQRLQAQLRPTDLLARLGGEEFVVILQPQAKADTEAAAERLRRAVADAPFTLDGGIDLTVTISLGVSWTPAATPRLGRELEQADRALYEAKHAGRNRVVLADTRWHA